MEIQKTNLYDPAYHSLESSQNEKYQLQNELAVQRDNARKMHSEHVRLKEENRKYQEALDEIRSGSLKAEQERVHLIEILDGQNREYQKEIDSLKRELLRSELDVMALQQRLERDQNMESEQSLHRELGAMDQMDRDLEILIADRSSEDEHDAVSAVSDDGGDRSKPTVFRGRTRKRSIDIVTLQDLASVIHKSHSDGAGLFATATPYDDRFSVYGSPVVGAMSMVSDLESERPCASECRSRAETSWMSLPQSPVDQTVLKRRSKNTENAMCVPPSDGERVEAMRIRLLLYDEEIRGLRKQNKMLINTHWQLRKYWNMELVKYRQEIAEMQQKKKSFVLSFMFK